MENESLVGAAAEEEYMELPPGFRFHPTDEELVTYYLSEKVRDSRFSARAIGEVDLNKCEPWDLPRRAKMGEKEWYFFCLKDRKYPTGFRTNRATDAGYWKATGKDREIYRAKSLVGMKKTLVFYRGRAPKGTKTNWVVHEYRVEGNYSVSTDPKTVKNEWVICRVFEKSSGGKKVIVHRPYDTSLPPLRDSSPSRSKQKKSSSMSHHVTCFSSGRADDPGTEEEEEEEEEMMEMFQTSLLSCSPPTTSSDMSPASALFHRSSYPNMGNHFQQHLEEGLMMVQENSVLRMLLEGQAEKVKRDSRAEVSQGSGVSNPELIQGGFDDQEHVGPVDLQCLWSY